MAQQLRALTALPEFSPQRPHGSSQLWLCNCSHTAVSVHRHTCRQNTQTRNIKINHFGKEVYKEDCENVLILLPVC